MPKTLTEDEKLCVTFHAPISLIKWMDAHASSRCMTRSTLLRHLVLDLRERTEKAPPSTATQDYYGPVGIMSVKEAKAAAKGRGHR